MAFRSGITEVSQKVTILSGCLLTAAVGHLAQKITQTDLDPPAATSTFLSRDVYFRIYGPVSASLATAHTQQ